MPASYQVKKKVTGGYSVGYACPHCSTALVSSLDEAGTSQACPNCNKGFVVPGKAEREEIKAKQELEKRAKAQAQAEQQQLEREKAKLKELDLQELRIQKAEAGAKEEARREYQESHCPYCWEEIQPGVKKCKHCHEYLDSALRSQAATQEVVRLTPPLEDVFWLVVKFWAASILFAFVCWLIVMLFLALLAAIGVYATR
jgi:hypothetical protein